MFPPMRSSNYRIFRQPFAPLYGVNPTLMFNTKVRNDHDDDDDGSWGGHRHGNGNNIDFFYLKQFQIEVYRKLPNSLLFRKSYVSCNQNATQKRTKVLNTKVGVPPKCGIISKVAILGRLVYISTYMAWHGILGQSSQCYYNLK